MTTLPPSPADVKHAPERGGLGTGAGNETRTRDPDLGKVVLYQLSYSRIPGREARDSRYTPWEVKARPGGHRGPISHRHSLQKTSALTGCCRLLTSQLGPRRAQVGHHRDQRRRRRRPRSAPPRAYRSAVPGAASRYSIIDSPTICRMVLYLPSCETATLRRCADLRHPLAQRRDRDLAADDDGRREHDQRARILAHQQHQRHGDDQLVGDRVEKGAEARDLPQPPREVAIQRIGDAGGGEQQARPPGPPTGTACRTAARSAGSPRCASTSACWARFQMHSEARGASGTPGWR